MTWHHWNVIFSNNFQLNLTAFSDPVSNRRPIRCWKFGVDILCYFQVIANIREGADHAPPPPSGARVNEGIFHTSTNINSYGDGRDSSAPQARNLTFLNHVTAKIVMFYDPPIHDHIHDVLGRKTYYPLKRFWMGPSLDWPSPGFASENRSSMISKRSKFASEAQQHNVN